MNALLETLSKGPLLADGAMGSYLFEQTGRLSEANHVYETFNVDRPQLIGQLQAAYLAAGARCLTTNTFAANRAQLAPLGLASKIDQINRAAAHLAGKSIEAHAKEHHDTGPFFVLGSVGPEGDDEAPGRMSDIYGEQLTALLGGGVDAVVLETFTSLSQIRSLLELIRSLDDPPPVIAHMSLRQSGTTGQWDQDPVAFVKAAADGGAAVVGVNCCAPWEATDFIDAVQDVAAVRSQQVLLSAMPNAGGFQRIGHRYMTRVNAEYMGKTARTLAEHGGRLIGGCCDVHPPHIREMAGYLTSRRRNGGHIVLAASPARHAPSDDNAKAGNGPLSRKIKEKTFAVSVELLPTRGTATRALQRKVEFVQQLGETGLADAVDVTDGSRGIALMPPGDFINLLRSRLGWTADSGDPLELIPHFTGRDLNTMGVQSRLIGYWANRIHNVLFVTGDPPKMSPTYPRSTAVFDLDSIDMIRLTHEALNCGVDFGGQPLAKHDDPRTHFTLGSGFEPEAVDLRHELDKLRGKIDAGANYIMTQPAFRDEPLRALEAFRGRVAILIGVMILTGLDHARRVGDIPGVVIPDEIFDRLAAFEQPADQRKVAIDIAVEQVQAARCQEWAGLYLMSPATVAPIVEVLEAGLNQPA